MLEHDTRRDKKSRNERIVVMECLDGRKVKANSPTTIELWWSLVFWNCLRALERICELAGLRWILRTQHFSTNEQACYPSALPGKPTNNRFDILISSLQ